MRYIGGRRKLKKCVDNYKKREPIKNYRLFFIDVLGFLYLVKETP